MSTLCPHPHCIWTRYDVCDHSLVRRNTGNTQDGAAKKEEGRGREEGEKREGGGREEGGKREGGGREEGEKREEGGRKVGGRMRERKGREKGMQGQQ